MRSSIFAFALHDGVNFWR